MRGRPSTKRSLVALGTTPLAGTFSRARIAWPLLIETALVLVAIAILLPLFARVATLDAGRDRRFADAAIAVRGFPEAILPGLCSNLGSLAEDVVRDRLCASGALFAAVAPAHPERMPAAIVDANARTREAFVAPLRESQMRLAELRLRQREGVGDLLALGNAVESIEAEVAPYVERYRIEGRDAAGPTPLACAYQAIDASLSYAGERSASRDLRIANALLLLGAALDGHPAAAALANVATLPASATRCAGLDIADAIAATSVLIADARAAPVAIAKNEAMRSLMQTAGWQWAAWSVAGLLLLNLSRRPRFAAIGLAIALATWALAAWAGRVPWPLAPAHTFVPGRGSSDVFAPPAAFVVALGALALVVLLASPWLRRAMATTPQTLASWAGYPGLVFATGVGWLLLLDLSANGHFGNRYLALYHQGHLWLGMLAFSVIAFARQPITRALAWMLAIIDGLASAVRIRIGSAASAVAFVVVTLALVGIVGALLLNIRQITSEIGRLWLTVGAAWFFFMRGTPLTERLARSGGSLASLVRYIAPLVFVIAVLIGAMLITHDMGPLLIDAYGAGAFVAASIAMWWHQRSGARRTAYALAGLLFIVWIVGATSALFEFGSLDDVTAARLENVAAPLASANDQLALVTWFQRAAPAAGFGLGSIPWCGYGASGGCTGVPAQIQSDYTFTALVGAFGWSGAWALTLGCAVWMQLLIRRHGNVTHGEPRLVRIRGRLRNDEQAFASWIVLTWIVLSLCQLAVTVAGNLAVIPLTGVTFPFVSFGMTSLVTNMALLALAINVNADPRRDD